MRDVLGVLAGLLLSGCFGTSEGLVRFQALPQREQDLMQRCTEACYPAWCGADRDTVYKTICLRSQAEKYAGLPTERARQEWLIANGCPPAMIRPGAALDRVGP